VSGPGQGLTVVQMLPALDAGGVERGTLEVARHLVECGHRSIVISAGGRLVADLEAQGSEHIAWDVGAKRPGTLRWVRPLRRLLAERRVDILHLRSRLPAWIGYLAWRGLPAAGRPHLVTTVHGLYSVGRYSAVMTHGERVIAVSETVRDYVLTHYPRVDPACIRVIARGVDRADYPYGYRPPADWLAAWRAEHPHLAGQYVLCLPGRLTRLKGHADLIEVVDLLRRRGIPAHGLVVGGAHPRKRAYARETQARVAAAGLADAFTFTGHRADLREVMAASDVVLSLSATPESFGRTTLEALSLGRPVAGYCHGGVGEQLRKVLPAGCLPVGDREALTERLAQWHASPPTVPARHPYTLAAMLEATLDVYRELCGE
jgi:glycosyltransferase involved in cell wall biosynthesis